MRRPYLKDIGRKNLLNGGKNDMHQQANPMAIVALILIAKSPGDPMESKNEAEALPGLGIVGDRYFNGIGTFSPNPQKADFELTFIEAEKIEEFASTSKLEFTAYHARRNIVTRGIDLNELVGKDFSVGGVRVRGMRLCEPCSYLAKITYPEALRGLVHKGGLRAQILSQGIIQVGDQIKV
ncbi:MAG: MOSC domain-containing protein [Verrucomicrobia bacterium]|nr:MOSC domain-containing protein [Verrucomicrobiota bacterium]